MNARLGIALVAVASLGLLCDPVTRDRLEIAGLEDRVRVTTDALGVPHVSATTLVDALQVSGYLHARDRFFQMEVRRRSAQGRLGELTGVFADVVSDAQTRILGLVAAAQRSEAILAPVDRELLAAYAAGVNAYLASNPLPPAFAQLEVTSVAPWTVLDSVLIEKGLSASLNLDIYQLSDGPVIDAYVAALGESAGRALFFDDIGRWAPMESAHTVPDAAGALPFVRNAIPRPHESQPLPQLARVRAGTSTSPEAAPHPWDSSRAQHGQGSNAWGVSGAHTESGAPLVAGDPHLALVAPSEFYEIHLRVDDDPSLGPLNVSGATLAGAPTFLYAQTDHLAWSLTDATGDMSDIFEDRLVRGDPGCPVPLCIETEGNLHPVERRAETYRLNSLDGVPDNSQDVTFVVDLQPDGRLATAPASVPFRSFGPILGVADQSLLDDPTGPPASTTVTTLQFTGLLGTREASFSSSSLAARTVQEFGQALRSFTSQSLHVVVADVAGTLGYFQSGEIPLRKDLEAGQLVGETPMLLRDGSGPANWVQDPLALQGQTDPPFSQGQFIPFRILPFEEMPQVVNPPSGIVVSSNNDATGLQDDNDLVNQFRLPPNQGAIYYLGAAPELGLRAGRITRLLQAKISAGDPIGLQDAAGIQGNNQLLDAELLTPHLFAAFDAAMDPSAPGALSGFASDAEVAEAIGRLGAWDFSTPTGISEGFDAAETDGVREPVSGQEAAHSVAATIYAVWRTKAIEGTMLEALAGVGLQQLFGQGSLNALHFLLQQSPFTGLGSSGIDFFPGPAGLDPAARRDVALLQALRDALDALASNEFAAAFSNSTDQDDYRWGRLNRFTMAHAAGGAFSIPPAAGFQDLSAGLPGIARDGGMETVNPSSFEPLSSGSNGFQFATPGTAARFIFSVGDPAARPDGVLGLANIAGGASGDPADPSYTAQLLQWLTVDHHPVPMNRRDVRSAAQRVELFEPAP